MNIKKAFTLVELLVVVAIIALLVSILLPAMGKAREAAKTTVCISNCHQWALGTIIYGADNKDCFPARMCTEDSFDGEVSSHVGAQDWYYYMEGSSRDFDLLETFIIPYIGNDEKYTDCPSRNKQRPTWEVMKNVDHCVMGDYSLFVGMSIETYEYLHMMEDLEFHDGTAYTGRAIIPPYKISQAKSTMAVAGDTTTFQKGAGWIASHPYRERGKIYKSGKYAQGMVSAFADGSARHVGYEPGSNTSGMVPFFRNTSRTYFYYWPNPQK